jgi:cytochrome P450
MGKALAGAYQDSSAYLTAAVTFAAGRCSASAAAPTAQAERAAAAARRLDDTFRGCLAERGAKPMPLAEEPEGAISAAQPGEPSRSQL